MTGLSSYLQMRAKQKEMSVGGIEQPSPREHVEVRSEDLKATTWCTNHYTIPT